MTEIKKRRGRPRKNTAVEQVPRADKPVDWEQLSKYLQAALESQIEENMVLIKTNEHLAQDNSRQEAIVSYLEARLDRAHHPV
jgi:putative ribosome biogenesis GTPase RsgA